MYGSNRSGKQTNEFWCPRGPFGNRGLSNTILELSLKTFGNGFSINGPYRNIGYVGKSSKFSENHTRYRGEYAQGYGGRGGTYYDRDHIYPSRKTDTLGIQYQYVKPSVLSTKGMLETKYKWINNGTFPNYIVNSAFLGNSNITDNYSQGVYIHNLTCSNDCVQDVNNNEKYKDYKVNHGPYGCHTQNADRFSWNAITSNAPYTKTIKQAITASQYLQRVQRKCVNGSRKHYPNSSITANNSCNVGLYGPLIY